MLGVRYKGDFAVLAAAFTVGAVYLLTRLLIIIGIICVPIAAIKYLFFS